MIFSLWAATRHSEEQFSTKGTKIMMFGPTSPGTGAGRAEAHSLIQLVHVLDTFSVSAALKLDVEIAAWCRRSVVVIHRDITSLASTGTEPQISDQPVDKVLTDAFSCTEVTSTNMTLVEEVCVWLSAPSEYHVSHIYCMYSIYIIMDYSLLYSPHRRRRGLSLSLQCNNTNQWWGGHVTS